MKNLVAQAVVYRMAIFVGVLFSLNALADTTLASFLNVEWSEISTESKWLIILVIFKSWSGTMLAFFNKTLSRIESGKTPYESGDTQTFTRSPQQQPSQQPKQQ